MCVCGGGDYNREVESIEKEKGRDRMERGGERGECCANASSKINANQIGTEIT